MLFSISRLRVFFGTSEHRISIAVDTDVEFSDEESKKLIACTAIDKIQLETPDEDIFSLEERFAANVAKNLKEGFEFNELKLTVDEDDYYLSNGSMYLKKKEKNDRFLNIPLNF